MMKIVYCIQSLYRSGGMERVLTSKVNYLSEQYGYEIHIAIMDGDKLPYFPLSTRIICHNLAIKNKKDYYQKLSDLLFTLRPDITVSLYGAEFTFLYKIKDGSKNIVEFHFTKYYLTYLINGIEHLRFRILHRLKAWYIRGKESFCVPKYDKVVLLTHQDLQIWGNKSNMCYIYNPISFCSDSVASLQNKRIIAVGRYMAQKGFDLLIEAFSRIAKKYPDWELYIFGEGQDEQFLYEKIRKYELTDQIHLCPPVHDIKKELLNSSIFAFPSRYEGFGLALTEAMECGLPCIAFDCECGPNEIVVDGETGFLIRLGDVGDFSSKMEILIQNIELRKEMGANGKISVRKFYAEKIMPQWRELFVQILN